MDLWTTVLLGFIAGVTILLGLPVAGSRRPMPGAAGRSSTRSRSACCSSWSGTCCPRPGSRSTPRWPALHEHTGGFAPVFGYGVLFVAGLGGRAARPGRLRRAICAARARRAPTVGGPGAMSVAERPRRAGSPAWSRRAPAGAADRDRHRAAQLRRGAGDRSVRRPQRDRARHAAGRSASRCTTRPRASASSPRWPPTSTTTAPAAPELGLPARHGAIGGGPTFLGTSVGHGFTSEPVSVIFLTLAAGSIIYVVVPAARRRRQGRRARTCSPTACCSACSPASSPTPIVTAAGV